MAKDNTSNVVGDSALIPSIEHSVSSASSAAHPLMNIEQRAVSSAASTQTVRFPTLQESNIQHERREGRVQTAPGLASLVFDTSDEKNQYDRLRGRAEGYSERLYVDDERQVRRSRSHEQPYRDSRSRSRSPNHTRPHSSSRHDRHRAQEVHADQDSHSRYSMGYLASPAHSYALPLHHPGSRKHQRWCPIHIHTAKCDKCLRLNVDILQRCVDGCNMQFCRFCLQAIIGRDNKHVAPDGGFDWTPKSKRAAKRRRSQVVAPASSNCGGRSLQADPLLAPFFHSSTRVISINSARARGMPSERSRSTSGRARIGDIAQRAWSWDRHRGDPDLYASVASEHFSNDFQGVDNDDGATVILENRGSEMYTRDTDNQSKGETARIIYRTSPQVNTSSVPNIRLTQGQYNPQSSLEGTHSPNLDEIQTFGDAVMLLEAMRSRPRISAEEEQSFQDMRMASWSEDSTLHKIKEEEGMEEAERVFQAVTLIMRLRLGFYGMS